MSLRELVDAECGGANALMRMGGHMMQDAARKDDGLAGPSSAGGAFGGRPAGPLDEQQMVNEFMHQIAPAPQTFRMDALLNEMRQMDAHQQPPLMRAPNVIDHVSRAGAASWANEFSHIPLGPREHVTTNQVGIFMFTRILSVEQFCTIV